MDVVIKRFIDHEGGPMQGFYTPRIVRKQECINTTATHFIFGKHPLVAKSQKRVEQEASQKPFEKAVKSSSSSITLASSIKLGID